MLILGHFTIIYVSLLCLPLAEQISRFYLLSVLEVVIFNIILEGFTAPVYHHSTGCFTCNAVKLISIALPIIIRTGMSILGELCLMWALFTHKFLLVVKYLTVLYRPKRAMAVLPIRD